MKRIVMVNGNGQEVAVLKPERVALKFVETMLAKGWRLKDETDLDHIVDAAADAIKREAAAHAAGGVGTPPAEAPSGAA